MRWRMITGVALACCLGAAVPSGTAAEECEGDNGHHGSLEKMNFGKTQDGQPVELYVLKNDKLTVKVITYGGIVTEILAPDRDGQMGDVVLGFEDVKDYEGDEPYLGATVGRVANRIANGEFTLNGKTYELAHNDGNHSLHGGRKGFNKVLWTAEEVDSEEGPSVRLSYTSPDGEEGYPGNLTAHVTFTLTDDGALRIDYEATTDQATPINLTNHSYFNLGGAASGSILDHDLMLASDQYTPVDDTLIPTGELASVAGTPLDFTSPTAIGQRIDQVKGDPGGYDHNFVIRGGGGQEPALAARVLDPESGRVLEMFTTEPGVQFYSGNFLDGTLTGKGGVPYTQHLGLCLEAQHFPDSVHHANFPSIILEPGKTYTQTTIYKFSAK